VERVTKKKIVSSIKIAFGVVLVTLSIWYCGRMLLSNWHEIQQHPISFRPGFIGPALGCMALHFFILSLGWQALTHTFRCGLPLKTSVPLWFITYLGRYIPGKVLFITGRIMAYTSLGTRLGPTTYATILDNIFHIYAAVVVGAGTLVWVPGLPFLVKVGLVSCAAGLSVIMLNPYLCNYILKKAAVSRGQMVADVHVPVTFPTLICLTLVYLSSYIPLALGLYFFSQCFEHIPFSHSSWLAGCLGCALAGGILAVITPSGLGVREGIFTWLLQFVINPDIAAVFAIATRVMMTVAELLCAGIAMILMFMQHKSLRLITRVSKDRPIKNEC